jgi:uncharacterized protein (DUF305 family)
LKQLAIVLLAAAVLGIAGCGGDAETEGVGAEQPTVAQGDVQFDRSFIDAMVPHHQTAIEMAKEAKKTGLSEPALLKIADNIIATQQAEIDRMLEWRKLWFGSREREPEAAALEMLGLSPAEAGMEHSSTDLSTADDVNQAFAGTMIGHHTGAIRMAELAKTQADHGELKTLAREIITAQQREIDAIQAYFMGAHG